MARSRSTSTSRSRRTPGLLFTVALMLFSLAAAAAGAYGQEVPTETDKPPKPPPTTRVRPPRIKRPVVVNDSARTAKMIESENFFDLGDKFYGKEKWNAAEAAYKEAVNLWGGNADALVALGYLYVDRNKLAEAQEIYARLRPVNSSYASQLQSEINKRKSQR